MLVLIVLCSNVFVDLIGGSALFYLGTYCMIADVSKRKSEDSSVVRFAFINGLNHIGFFLGNSLAGPIKSNLGLRYNFALGLLFAVISAAYTIIFIKETLIIQDGSTDIYANNGKYKNTIKSPGKLQ